MVPDMKQAVLLFLASLVAAAPAAAAERRYPVTDFDRVIVDGPFVVRLVPARTSSATASGDRRALDALIVDSQGQTLRIRRASGGWGGYPGEETGGAPVTIELATRNLRSARLIGPGRFEIEGARGMEVELVVEGGGHLRATGIAADEVTLGLVGSGRLQAAGSAEAVTILAQGTGDLDAGMLAAENLRVDSTGAGTVTAAASETATINANGVGTVQVIGRPECTLRGTAAGLVRCGRSDQR